MTRDDDLHWSEGLKLRPDQYFTLGMLSVALPEAQRRLDMSHGVNLDGLYATPAEEDLLGEVLDELLEEDQALENWAANGDPAIDAVLNAMTADPADMPYGQHMDDLSGGSYGSEITLADVSDSLEFSQSVELVNGTYGPSVADRLAARGVPHMIPALARSIDREARSLALENYEKSRGGNRRAEGDLLTLAASYANLGTAGHDVETANAPGSDSFHIELARSTGDYPPTCSVPDALGRCSATFHTGDCSHVQEASAAYGVTPEDSAAWRSTLGQHAALPLADQHGQVACDQHGQPVTGAGWIEAATGEVQGRPLLGRYAVPKPEPRSPYQPPQFAPSTRATAARIMQQDQRLQARTQSAVGRGFTPAEQAAHSRRMQHPDNRWPVLEAQRAERLARHHPVTRHLDNGALGGLTFG